CLEWLRKNGHEGVIKNQVIATLSRGEDSLVSKVLAALRDAGISQVSHKEDVHYQTLQALLRELAHEPGFPRDLFAVHEVKKVVVK
ncbi:hypothetical protein RZS08_16130, partial [Arthrospira platensis SPKY1]|nr:hypothetical protein [Arthrospira platensis SPKY1]